MQSSRDALLAELCWVANRADSVGLQSGNGGNLSCRVPDEQLMLVTASGSAFSCCDSDSFILTDFSGVVVDGVGTPTREAFMHGQIYQSRPDVNAVVHVHSPFSIAVGRGCSVLPKPTHHSRMKLNSPLPVLAVDSPMVRSQDWIRISRVLEQYPDLEGFLLKDHGFVAMARSLKEAEFLSELVEECSKIALLESISSV